MSAPGPSLVSGTPSAVELPAVVVLVGTSGSGKTTYRRQLLDAGLPPESVVSMDDLRRSERTRDVAGGRRPRPLQSYSGYAARTAIRRCEVLAAFGAGYLADATHLVRRERRRHVVIAADTGLRAAAVLTPLLADEELLRRNAARPPDEQVPHEALLRQQHRRSLLSAELLREEGFQEVREL